MLRQSQPVVDVGIVCSDFEKSLEFYHEKLGFEIVLDIEMPDGAVINDELGGEPVVITFDRDSNTAIPYFSHVGGRELTFYSVEATSNLPVEFQDVETGMRWNM